MLIVSCTLIYDDAIRACAVSTVTADTGQESLFYWYIAQQHLIVLLKLIWLVPGAEAKLKCASEKSLVWCGCKKIHRFHVLINAFLVKKKGTKSAVLSRVTKGVAKLRSVVATPGSASGVQALRWTILVKYSMSASKFISIYGKIGYHLTRYAVLYKKWFLT